MAQQGLATQAARETAPAIRVGTLPDEIKQMFDSVARRAYEIFESKGPPWGHDLEDWLQAERELFHPAHISVSESAAGLSIRAELPGFNAKEVEVNIEGRRVTISARREAREEKKDKKSIFSEYCSNQVLRVVDLPTDVKVAESKANIRDGVLTLELPKVVPAQSIPVTGKSA